MKTQTIGRSVLGLPLLSYEFSKKPEKPHLLILAGVHGDETEGVIVAKALLSEWIKDYPYNIKTTLIPLFNPDGVFQKRRVNENLVDLNRNLPTKDWNPEVSKEKYHPGKSPNSEPENQALTEWIEKNSPSFIISLHSWKPMLNVNGNCEPISKILSQKTGYKITENIGYPTPGSLGTYSGKERNIPTLTYEIERGASLKEMIKLHVPALKEALFSL